jgi:hypothetical protein
MLKNLLIIFQKKNKIFEMFKKLVNKVKKQKLLPPPPYSEKILDFHHNQPQSSTPPLYEDHDEIGINIDKENLEIPRILFPTFEKIIFANYEKIILTRDQLGREATGSIGPRSDLYI